MSRLNYNRPNGGYEKEPWQKVKFRSSNTGLARTIHEETCFIRGKYFGKKIKDIIKADPRYCDWVLENEPKSIVAQQIIKHFKR